MFLIFIIRLRLGYGPSEILNLSRILHSKAGVMIERDHHRPSLSDMLELMLKWDKMRPNNFIIRWLELGTCS